MPKFKLFDYEHYNILADRTHRVRCVLGSSIDPSSLNVTGADVEGLNATDIIAAGSVLITPSKNYIAFEDGIFTEKG